MSFEQEVTKVTKMGGWRCAPRHPIRFIGFVFYDAVLHKQNHAV
jgi:hypothetical protein